MAVLCMPRECTNLAQSWRSAGLTEPERQKATFARDAVDVLDMSAHTTLLMLILQALQEQGGASLSHSVAQHTLASILGSLRGDRASVLRVLCRMARWMCWT